MVFVITTKRKSELEWKRFDPSWWAWKRKRRRGSVPRPQSFSRTFMAFRSTQTCIRQTDKVKINAHEAEGEMIASLYNFCDACAHRADFHFHPVCEWVIFFFWTVIIAIIRLNWTYRLIKQQQQQSTATQKMQHIWFGVFVVLLCLFVVAAVCSAAASARYTTCNNIFLKTKWNNFMLLQ